MDGQVRGMIRKALLSELSENKFYFYKANL